MSTAPTRQIVRPGAAFAVALVATACSMAPEPMAIPVVERLPETLGASSTDSTPSTAWWSNFEDETLDGLVVSALSANLDIREATARIEEVRAQYRIARAPLLPSVTASADVSRFSQPANTGQFGAILGGGEGDEGGDGTTSRPTRFSFSTFGASLGFAYELDFWGALNGGRRAAMADFMATGADLRTVEIAVASETIAGYFEIRELVERQEILTEVVDLLSERLTLAEDRYQRGVASSIEVYQIRRDLNATRAGLPLLESQLTASRGRLAVLLGRYPQEIDALLADGAAPEISADAIPAGLPSDLLARRPDLQSAALRLEASRQRVGVRKAARFPVISLTGSAGTQSGDLGDIVRADQWFTNFVASLTAPLFSGGRLKAEQEAAEARYEQEAFRYARAVLVAFQEVDAALAEFEAQRQRTLVVEQQLVAAQDEAESQLERVEQGVGEYVAYLDALRTLLGTEETRAAAERALATARLDVHRALGGNWMPEDIRDTRSTEEAR